MPEPAPHQITLLLEQVKAGDTAARAELAAIVYPQLKRLAADRMRGERPHHTLQPTALVHEAFLRLMGTERMTLRDRNHFFAIASDLMREILVDYARRRHAAKRGGGAEVLELEAWQAQIEDRPDLVIDIDRLLTRLSAVDARQAEVVKMRYFSGLTEAEIAETLGISERTVKRDWNMARAWMRKELAENDTGALGGT
jgi:RNA polymerase sigma-70 factor (ECF subfamily)